jgi:hypothetical protein
MAEIVQSLFGVTPESYQQAQQQRADAQALRYAQLDPFEQANYAVGRGAYGLAGAIGGALGGQDPELQRISMRQQIARQLNPNEPASIQQGIAALSQAGDSQGAMMLQAEYRKLVESNALVGQRGAAATASQAQAQKTQLSIDQENKLRGELSKLPANATEAEIRAVVVKYGDPDKVLTALTTAATREADRDARADAAKIAADARLEAARIAADARLEAAREAGANRLQIAQLMAQNKQELATLAASLKGPKVLSSALQKEEDKELELVDSLTARSEALQPAVASLTPDPVTKKPPLALGPVNNLRYQAQNAAGNSTPESRAYAQLQRSVQEATNLKTDAAKGVQTDKDVLRFANELIAAFGKNDTQTTLDALNNFVKTTDKARTNAQKRIDSRRKSQGIEPYYGPQAGTPQNPIKLGD